MTDGGSTGFITLTPDRRQQGEPHVSFFSAAMRGECQPRHELFHRRSGDAGRRFRVGCHRVSAPGLTVTSGISSAASIRIGFGPNAYNVGINNINFSVTPVPEPESHARCFLPAPRPDGFVAPPP